MSISVNSFLFGSLLTSAKMTALQDSWIHVQSSFQEDHFYNGATLVTSHKDTVMHNYPGDIGIQQITSKKKFTERLVISKDLEVGSYSFVTGDDGHIRFQSIGVGRVDGFFGRDDTTFANDAIYMATNQRAIGTQDDAAQASYAAGLNQLSDIFFVRKKNAGGSFFASDSLLLALSTTGIVSAGHIPSAGRAFGGIAKTGDVTITASVNWENITGVTSGALHCRNFTIDPQITVTYSAGNGQFLRIFAVGSITINGAIVVDGESPTAFGSTGAVGASGLLGGSGGGGGSGLPSTIGQGLGGPTATTTFGGASPIDYIALSLAPTLLANMKLISFGVNLQGAQGGTGGGDVSVGNAGQGGTGGGLIYLEAPLIAFSNVSTLLAQGGAGGSTVLNGYGGGGGGGGGIIYLKYRDKTDAGVTTSVVGGALGAGDTGGGGSDGFAGGNGILLEEIMI